MFYSAVFVSLLLRSLVGCGLEMIISKGLTFFYLFQYTVFFGRTSLIDVFSSAQHNLASFLIIQKDAVHIKITNSGCG